MSKRTLGYLYFPMVFLLLSFNPYAVEAQDLDLKEAYGMVKKISKGEMVVTVYDQAKATANEETFYLRPETQLVIVRPATEVIEGDEVKINYREEKGKKNAQFVSILDLPPPASAETKKKS